MSMRSVADVTVVDRIASFGWHPALAHLFYNRIGTARARCPVRLAGLP